MADDRTTAHDAYGLAGQGTALLWRGDFHNARQLLTAMASRIERHARRSRRGAGARRAVAETFHLHRQAQAQRARTLGALLIPLEADYTIPLRRAPDARQACLEAFGPGDGPALMSLRALLGVIGAHQWRLKGIEVPAAGGRIHPHYGVFAPIRAEYVELVAAEPLPAALAAAATAFDIGTGTGVLAAVLARRGTWARGRNGPRSACARLCAREPRAPGRCRAGRAAGGRSVPAGPRGTDRLQSTLAAGAPEFADRARHLRPGQPACCAGSWADLPEHLTPGGEGWLVLSDLAEHLQLRSREQLLAMFASAGSRGHRQE